MYAAHFGLNLPPFKITPNTEFFYPGGKRGAVLEALQFAILQGEGIIKVTGEVGSGKTMLCRMLAAGLPESVETVYLANPNVAPDDLLQAICFELQIPHEPTTPRQQLLHLLQSDLLAKHREGKRVVLLVEEAQGMPLATLEEMRLLSNLETEHDKLLQIILFGQPELNANLSNPAIRQLKERITHSFDLSPFSREEISDYLKFRLRAAGHRDGEVFDQRAIRAIAAASGGLVRRINILADKTLLAAYSEGTRTVHRRHVAAAVRDSEFAPLGTLQSRHLTLAIGLLIGVALSIALWLASSHATPSQKHAPDSENSTVPKVGASGAPDGSTQHPPLPLAPGEPASSPLEKHLAQTTRWLKDAPPSTFTIQLLGAPDETRAASALAELGRSIEPDRIFVYRTTINGEPAFTLTYGSFESLVEASRARDALPGSLKANRPLLRSVNGIRKELGTVAAEPGTS